MQDIIEKLAEQYKRGELHLQEHEFCLLAKMFSDAEIKANREKAILDFMAQTHSEHLFAGNDLPERMD